MWAASFGSVPHPFPPVSPPTSLERSRAVGGFSTVQALIAMSIVMIAGLSSIQALTVMNRKAASMRTLNSALAIAQRNIDTALGVPFNSTNPVPAILAIGSGAYDDDGDGDTTVPIVVARNGTSRVVSGTLTRTVTAEANAAGADLRRVTFTVGWSYRSRPYTISMTTLRTTD